MLAIAPERRSTTSSRPKSDDGVATAARARSARPTRDTLPLFLRDHDPHILANTPRVGSPDDLAEREADTLAERAVRAPERPAPIAGMVSQQGETFAALPSPPTGRGARTESGQSLDPSLRAVLEPRLGRDLSPVRVHTGPAAANSASAIGAKAYATGHDIVFGRDAFQPRIPSGLHLLAHELAHIVQQRDDGGIARRQMTPASAADHRDMVRMTIEFLQGTVHFLELRGAAKLDRATFDRLLNSWYVMAVDRERSIDTVLGGDAALRTELRDSFRAAIRVLMSQAATAFTRQVGDLYNENSGRIPLWGWETPHQAVPGISTPVPEGRSPNAAGSVNFASNGVNIVILPDAASSAAAMTNRAETSLRSSPLAGIQYSWRQVSGERVVSSFTAPGPVTLTIQTTYGPGVSATSRSGYGRGTTAEDVAGGRVTPHSTTLGFHEGSHGVDYLSFISRNPPPVFGGAAGMTETAFRASEQAWHAAWTNYIARVTAFSERRTDCVGATTIDDSNRARAGVGATVTLVCRP